MAKTHNPTEAPENRSLLMQASEANAAVDKIHMRIMNNPQDANLQKQAVELQNKADQLNALLKQVRECAN